ncbi:putative transcription factor AS2-LOB family [Helianthus annuus]|nr:putative transcription factor AS2-LOB family [Helianthus annuus]
MKYSGNRASPPQPVVLSPCAACKILRRRCVENCVFAPYFPSTEPHKFAIVHRVFGASNINKIFQELPESHRGDAVSSMVYEAKARLRYQPYVGAGAVCQLQKEVMVIANKWKCGVELNALLQLGIVGGKNGVRVQSGGGTGGGGVGGGYGKGTSAGGGGGKGYRGESDTGYGAGYGSGYGSGSGGGSGWGFGCGLGGGGPLSMVALIILLALLTLIQVYCILFLLSRGQGVKSFERNN